MVTWSSYSRAGSNAYALEGDRDYLLHLGFDGDFVKPLLVKELEAEIRRCMKAVKQ
jgi:hypothetical protein